MVKGSNNIYFEAQIIENNTGCTNWMTNQRKKLKPYFEKDKWCTIIKPNLLYVNLI